MLFNSLYFIMVFLPVALFGYFLLIKKRFYTGRKVWLVMASLYFYAYWNLAYLPLILSSLLINFLIGVQLAKYQNNRKVKKNILIVGIVFNLVLLGYFKYVNFFVENLNWALGTELQLNNILLPLAISFFTFQQIAYLVDSYKGEIEEYSLLNYALFVTFFPQLIAGPIVHHKEMMEQFDSKWNLLPEQKNILIGIALFALGLFKKVVIADNFSSYVDAGYAAPEKLDLISAWLTTLSYSMQLYFDFSGYCDMATGIALLFNIKLPLNFNSPYKSLTIQDFWRRWHITLGSFLRSYLYIPLGGNKGASYKVYRNLFITVVVAGIWHGAGWLFVIWGVLHGIALVIHRFWQQFGVKLPSALAWLVTFNFINFAWVFFRAEDLSIALMMLKRMCDLTTLNPSLDSIAIDKLAWLGRHVDWLVHYFPSSLIASLDVLLLNIVGFYLLANKNAMEFVNNKNALSVAHLFYYAAVFSISIIALLSSKSTVFLYFNF